MTAPIKMGRDVRELDGRAPAVPATDFLEEHAVAVRDLEGVEGFQVDAAYRRLPRLGTHREIERCCGERKNDKRRADRYQNKSMSFKRYHNECPSKKTLPQKTRPA
jgi:hypothetical protein